MKASKLAEILNRYPDFDVQASFCSEPKEGDRFLNYQFFTVEDISDIGHSEKSIMISLEKIGGD